MANNEYVIEYAKTGRSSCKLKDCKALIAAQDIRVGKQYDSYFGDHKQNDWFHLDCIFESLAKARATTKKITSSEDLQGFDQLSEADQDFILKKIKQFNSGSIKAQVKAKSKSVDAKQPQLKLSPTKSPDSNKNNKNVAKSPAKSPLKSFIQKNQQRDDRMEDIEEDNKPAYSWTSSFLKGAWLEYLGPLIEKLDTQKAVFKQNSSNSINAKALIRPYADLAPNQYNVVIISTSDLSTMNPGYLFGPKDSSISLSELNDSSDEDLLPIKNIAMSVIQNASEDQLKQPVQEWMEYCHKQGVMWLPLYQNTNSKNELAAKLVKAWPAILLKIIKIILEEKANGPKKRGLVFILLGKKARSLEQMIVRYYKAISTSLAIRILTGKHPSKAEFDPQTLFSDLDGALQETNNKEIKWLLDESNFMFYLKTESGKMIQLAYDESVNLGRGDLLGIDDKKVSRQQATVTAKREPEPHVAVTPLGSNPMFLIDDNTMKRLENNKVTMISKNSSFTLCAAKYPLTVLLEAAPADSPKKGNNMKSPEKKDVAKPKLEKIHRSSDDENDNKKGVKRKAAEIEEDDWNAHIPSKRAKINDKKSQDYDNEDFNPSNEEADPLDNVILPDSPDSLSD
jgi:hypothetical protein